MTISLAKAETIADSVLRNGQQRGTSPLTVAVLDPGGHLVAFKRQDGSGILRPQIAFGKAWGALGMGKGSAGLEQMALERPTFFASLSVAAEGRLLFAAGGVLVKTNDGAVLGAVGVSGDTSDRDELCAVEAITAAGYQPDTGLPPH